jgi:hypothetical protein
MECLISAANAWKQGVGFHFKHTGYRFVKDGACYLVPRPQQHRQAKKANIDYRPR